MNYSKLLQQYPIISDQITAHGLSVVLRELEHALERRVTGDIVEFGCYIGTTSLFIRRLLDQEQPPERRFFAYDSFAGLPAKSGQDKSAAGMDFTAGALSVSKRQFLDEFHKAHLKPPLTHKGWFGELSADQLPDSIAFAFLDGDFYDSIIDSLRLVWPRLQAGGIIAIDDFKRDTLPGVERAITDFFQGKAVNLMYEHNIAIITGK